MGLGLAIVRHLVELHGGTVFAQSAGLGRGAQFVIEVPRTARNQASGERHVAERPASRITPTVGLGNDGSRRDIVDVPDRR